MKRYFLCLTIACWSVLALSAQTVEWTTRLYTGGENPSVDVVATIHNTLEEPCIVLINQRVTEESYPLERIVVRKMITSYGDFSLSMFYWDNVDFSKKMPTVLIPEEFMKKVGAGEVFRMVIATKMESVQEVQDTLSNRIIMAPLSLMNRIFGSYDEINEECGLYYQPDSVSVHFGDLWGRLYRKREGETFYDWLKKLPRPVEAKPTFDIDDIVPMDSCDEWAEFPGGLKEGQNFFREHFEYPSELSEMCIQGRLLLSFVVEKDGSISDVKVLRSPHEALNRPALKVMEMMPKWKPALWRGEVVRSKLVLPFSYHNCY